MANQQVNGLDISYCQGSEIDSLIPGEDKVVFVICKATEGATGSTAQDPCFANNWQLAAKKGFIRGAYHFYHYQDTAQQQGDNFLSFVNKCGGFSIIDLPPVIDIEEGGLDNCTNVADIQQSVLALLQYVSSKTNRTPIIYTNQSMAQTYLNNSGFAKYPLYIAEYNSASAPDLTGTPWESAGWFFWQTTDQKVIDNTNNDYDVFNGDINALHAFISSH